jgi:aminopeptidase N
VQPCTVQVCFVKGFAWRWCPGAWSVTAVLAHLQLNQCLSGHRALQKFNHQHTTGTSPEARVAAAQRTKQASSLLCVLGLRQEGPRCCTACCCRYYTASCMTDRLAALELLVDEDSPARTAALQHFCDTYSSQPLAMLKWLYVQVGHGIQCSCTPTSMCHS